MQHRWACGECGAIYNTTVHERCELCHPLPTTNLDFGQALAAMRDGKVVQRGSTVMPMYMLDGDRLVFLVGNRQITKDVMLVPSLLATDWPKSRLVVGSG